MFIANTANNFISFWQLWTNFESHWGFCSGFPYKFSNVNQMKELLTLFQLFTNFHEVSKILFAMGILHTSNYKLEYTETCSYICGNDYFSKF